MFGTNRFRGKEVNYRQEEKKILDSVLGADVYDKRIRPSGINSTGQRDTKNKYYIGLARRQNSLLSNFFFCFGVAVLGIGIFEIFRRLRRKGKTGGEKSA